MKLNLKDVAAIAHGALRVEDHGNGAIALYRFTEKQQDLYDHTKDFGNKARAASGIRLELATNTSLFSFDYHVFTASSRRFYYFDVYVDGVMVKHHGHEGLKEAKGTLSVKLGEGMHTVTVYFPCLFGVKVSNVTLDDGCVFAPVVRKTRLLCYGDSITQGYDATYSSQSYANLLADKLEADMVDQGIGGEIFRPALIDPDMDYDPDIITVAYGTNDWSGQERESMVKNANEFFARLRVTYPRAKIFAITPIWRADDDRVTKVGSFEEGRQIVRDAALAQKGVVVIEGDGMIPHLCEVCSDAYLHPNDYGFKFYANALHAAMLPHL